MFISVLRNERGEPKPGISDDHLQHLFNQMLSHAFVPCQFCLGTIVLLVKDRQGDAGDLNNYWGITLAPIISKIFEHALKIQFVDHLTTSNYQYSFKRKSLTSHAIYLLKETINHYTQKGSNVFCSIIDASKAFNRLVHARLFSSWREVSHLSFLIFLCIGMLI